VQWPTDDPDFTAAAGGYLHNNNGPPAIRDNRELLRRVLDGIRTL
jgi:hypothetical protein